MKPNLKKWLNQLKNNDQSLTSLNLWYNEINNSSVKHLSQALKINQSLTLLNLGRNQIGAAGARHLSKALKINQSLTSLELGGNEISDTGAQHLSQALETNQSLTSLELRDNEISDTGAQYLSQALETNQSLTSLDLRDNEISDTGAKHLSKALKRNQSLTSLDLGGNKISATGIQHLSQALIRNQSLTSLSLWHNQISDTGAQYLCQALETNQSLNSLDLRGNPISNTGSIFSNIGPQLLSQALEKNFTVLVLKGVESPAISKYLERNNKIAHCLKPLTESLSKGRLLTDSETIEACISGLEKLIPDLAELPEGSYPQQAYRLLKALVHYSNSTIKPEARLNALHALLPPFKLPAFQKIADKTLGLLLSGEFKKTLQIGKLEQEGLLLSLYGLRKHLHEPETRAFIEIALFQLIDGKELMVGQKQAFDQNLVILSEYQLLCLLKQALVQLDPDSDEAKLIGALVSLGVCNDAALSAACQSNTFLKVFKAQYPQAKSFTAIEHCLFTASNQRDSFLIEVPHEPRQEVSADDVETFSLQGHVKSLNDVVASLKESFGHFSPDNPFDTSDAKSIKNIARKLSQDLKTTQSLTSLDLHNNKISATGAQHLSNALEMNQSLTSLNLGYNQISDIGAQHLSRALETNQNLTSLDLTANKISATGAQHLSNALEMNQSLTSLDLGLNPISDTGAQHLSRALETNQSLISLGLTHNQISATGAQHLSQALKINPSLTSLDLGYNKISDIGVRHLSKTLETNQSLTSLNLGYNKISDTGVRHLSKTLEINQCLTSLVLWGNQISGTGAQRLSQALEINQSLISLELDHNQISATGAQYISQVLKRNQSLKSLGLDQNQIGAIGAQHLSKALEINQTLISLNLVDNQIRDTGAEHLSQALKRNQSLTSLNLGHNQISNIGAQHLSNALKINQSLTSLSLWHNKFDDTGTQHLSNALKINQSLTSLILDGNEIGATGARHLSDALEINQSLTSLDLHKNHIGDTGAKHLSKALELNQSLSSLNLRENPIDETGVQHLSKALEKNFTLLEFEGVDSPAISKYLKRNNKIAHCLKPLTESLSKGHLLTDGVTIQACIVGLGLLIPGLAELPEDSYPQQAYRLLTALGHYSHSYMAPEARPNALHALLPPFKLPAFQKIADKTLGLLLSGEFKKTLQDGKLGREGLLLSLYGLRKHLHEPETLAFIQIALFHLSEDKDFTFEQKQAFDQNLVILSEYQLLGLLKQALVQLDPDSHEAKLIGSLVSFGVCNDVALSAACQSNTFLAMFKAQYPQAKSFTTIEHCLFTASNENNSFLIEIPQEPRQEVSAELVENIVLLISQSHTKSLDDVVKPLKDSLDNHRFSVESKALDEGWVDETQVIAANTETRQKVQVRGPRQENPLQQFGFFQNRGNEEGFTMEHEMVLQTPKRD